MAVKDIRQNFERVICFCFVFFTFQSTAMVMSRRSAYQSRLFWAKIVSEFDQEIPLSQTADKPMAS